MEPRITTRHARLLLMAPLLMTLRATLVTTQYITMGVKVKEVVRVGEEVVQHHTIMPKANQSTHDFLLMIVLTSEQFLEALPTITAKGVVRSLIINIDLLHHPPQSTRESLWEDM